MPKIWFCILMVSIYLESCVERTFNPPVSDAIIDSTIKQRKVYKKMDLERDIYSFSENSDSLSKRSNDVAYESSTHILTHADPCAKNNTCQAYVEKSGILSIDIGIADGFTGSGFIIKYKDGVFFTKPYQWNCMGQVDGKEPVLSTVYEHLTLDKFEYMEGDSIYGKIEFKIKEITPNDQRIEHMAKGYFRTKIRR